MSGWFKRFMAEWWIEILVVTLIVIGGLCLWLPKTARQNGERTSSTEFESRSGFSPLLATIQ